VLVTTESLHLLSMTHGLGCIAQGTDPHGVAVAPSGRWFATAAQATSDRMTVSIRHLTMSPGQGVKISAPRTANLPTQSGDALVTLMTPDDRHAVLVMHRGSRTVFYGVTRRGTYLGAISASVPIYNLVATSRPYRYLALEKTCPNAVLIVDLMPFRILRYRVNIAPRWLFETVVGYGLLSQDGDFALINDEGRVMNRMTGLPRPTAIVQRTPTQNLWSVNEGDRSRIYTVNLGDLASDILF
jgi:serine/threonine-protein kinase